MVMPETEIRETVPVVGQGQPQSSKNAIPQRTADKRAEAVRAMKRKRAAHRVALRRSNTGG